MVFLKSKKRCVARANVVHTQNMSCTTEHEHTNGMIHSRSGHN